MQGGKIVTPENPNGALSTHGTKFCDEDVWLPHAHPGIVSMANAGPNTNGSSFFICFTATPHLDGKHHAIGRVIKGYSICDEVEKLQ